MMQPDRVGPDRHDRVHRLIAGLRTETLSEGQQLAVNKLEKTMLGNVLVGALPKRVHEHGIFLCCLQELATQVKEYASELTEVEPDKVEALLELLSLHVEEGWESFDGDIVAPEAADLDFDPMSDDLSDDEGAMLGVER